MADKKEEETNVWWWVIGGLALGWAFLCPTSPLVPDNKKKRLNP